VFGKHSCWRVPIDQPGWTLSGRIDEDWFLFILRRVWTKLVAAPTRRGIIHRNGDECSLPIFGALRIETWHYGRQTGRSRSPPRNGRAEGNGPSSTVGGMGGASLRAARRSRAPLVGAPTSTGGAAPVAAQRGRRSKRTSLYVSKRPRHSWCRVGAWPARRMHAKASKVCQEGHNPIDRRLGIAVCENAR
jgi:hypothetical protein